METKIMTTLLSLLTLLVVSPSSFAEAPHYTCGLVGVANIANYTEGSALVVPELSEDGIELLQSMIDYQYDCDEGVELIGALKKNGGVVYSAYCSKDSLGAMTVEVKLVCVDGALK